MSYEVQFQHAGAEYIVRGPDIDGVLRLIRGVQGAEDKSDYERCQEAAVTTLRGLKYEWRGGESWVPPGGSKPADDGWVEWSGGARPVAPDQRVLVCLRNGNSIGPEQAYLLSWFHNGFAGDIMRYRVCE